MLRNFSVVETSLGLNFDYIVKEYAIHVDEGTLNVTFTPSTNASKAYAFVNGVEVGSMPDIYSSSTDEATMIVGTDNTFTIDNNNALVNMYAKFGDMNCAHTVFDQLPSKDAISWNTLITVRPQFWP